MSQTLFWDQIKDINKLNSETQQQKFIATSVAQKSRPQSQGFKAPKAPVNIKKTCLYNFDPLKPHFYIVKLVFTGVYLFFLFLLKNIVCGTR